MAHRLVSNKSQKMLQNLLYETKKNIKFAGNSNWNWANTPIEGETRNSLNDMLLLIDSKERSIHTGLSLGVLTNEQATLERDAYKIIRKHVLDRLAVKKEVYG